MRLYLLPVSTRRTLLYCPRLNVTTTDRVGLADRVTTRAARLWASWEKKEGGWQKRVVGWGNAALRRIPFEEWGLRSVPPLSAHRGDDELRGRDKVELVFPGGLVPVHKAEGVLARLGSEREALHRRKLIWCFVGMPVTIPFILIPVIPNIPFFYLAYRAWSHWRAISGGKHVQFLCKNKLLALSPSSALDQIYTDARPSLSPIDQEAEGKESGSSGDSSKDGESKDAEEPDALLLDRDSPREIAEALEVPEVEAELERARWQVDGALKAAAEKAEKPRDPSSHDDSEKKSQ